jgi:hypothetical protein
VLPVVLFVASPTENLPLLLLVYYCQGASSPPRCRLPGNTMRIEMAVLTLEGLCAPTPSRVGRLVESYRGYIMRRCYLDIYFVHVGCLYRPERPRLDGPGTFPMGLSAHLSQVNSLDTARIINSWLVSISMYYINTPKTKRQTRPLTGPATRPGVVQGRRRLPSYMYSMLYAYFSHRKNMAGSTRRQYHQLTPCAWDFRMGHQILRARYAVRPEASVWLTRLGDRAKSLNEIWHHDA